MNRSSLNVPATLLFFAFVIFFATTESKAAFVISKASCADSASENFFTPGVVMNTQHLSFLKRLKLMRESYRLQHNYRKRNHDDKNGLAALMCGIVGLCSIIGLAAILLSLSTFEVAGASVVLICAWGVSSILAVALGILGMKRDRHRGLGIAGMAIGFVELGLLSLGLLILLLATT